MCGACSIFHVPRGDEMISPSLCERLLVYLLRLAGGLMLVAVLALLMPRPWMAAVHSWLGLGQFPPAPIAEYLARLTSGMYTIVGGALVLASKDVRRYDRMISYLVIALAALSVAIFLLLLGKLPVFFILPDPVTAVGLAAVVLVLQRRMRK